MLCSDCFESRYRSKPTDLIAHLIVLFSSANAPQWFKSNVNFWLSRVLMRDVGVYAVFQTMLNGAPIGMFCFPTSCCC